MTLQQEDSDELARYFATWNSAIDDALALLDEVPEDEWSTPTDLPGWSVHDVAAHLAHLEHLLAGGAHEDADIGTPDHVTSPMDTFTEQGIVARRERSKAEVIDELRRAVQVRRADWEAAPLTDGSAPAHGLFGAIGWNVRTLLKNRPLDVWMHEQDIRRAVDLPGNTDTPAARHTVDYLAGSLGFVLGKRVGAPTGTSAVLHVEDAGDWAVEIDATGRAQGVETPESPSVWLGMSIEDFGVLAGGRRHPGHVRIIGDEELAARILDHFAVTP